MIVDEARHAMVTELHRALYGDAWARPESPQAVWEGLLAKVRVNAAALREIEALADRHEWVSALAIRRILAAITDTDDAPRCQHVIPTPWGTSQCALPQGHDDRHAYDPTEEQP